MKYLDVRVRLPDEYLHPMLRFIREEDAVRYEEVLCWNVRPAAGVESALYYVEGDVERHRAAAERLDSVLDHQYARIDEESAHVWACEETRAETRAWRSAFADRQLVVVPPVRFDDEAVIGMTVVGDGGDIQAVLDELPDEVGVSVLEIGSYDRRGGTLAGALTDRQLVAIGTALDAGYYEVPRTGSLAAVADALGCTESTASELLRRAERTVFTRVLERYGGNFDRIAQRAAEPTG